MCDLSRPPLNVVWGNRSQTFPTQKNYNCFYIQPMRSSLDHGDSKTSWKPQRSDDSPGTVTKSGSLIGRYTLAAEIWPESTLYLAITQHHWTLDWSVQGRGFLRSHENVVVNELETKERMKYGDVTFSSLATVTQAEKKKFTRFNKEWFSIKNLSLFSHFFSYFDTLC